AERFRPVDRKQEGTGRTEKTRFGALVDFPDELDAGPLQHRLDLLTEIGFVGAVDLGRNLERNAQGLGDPDGAVGPLFRRDASKERNITPARNEIRRVQIGRNSMVYGCREV